MLIAWHFSTTTATAATATTTTTTLHYTTPTNYTTPQLQLQMQLHYTNYTTLQLQFHYTTATATTATTASLHHTMSWPLQPLQPLQKNTTHLSVHQWIHSAIRDSQQPTSPIGFFFFWNFRHRLVRYYWYVVWWMLHADHTQKLSTISRSTEPFCWNLFVLHILFSIN